MHTYQDIFRNKKRVLFVMAHPDDVDVFFGGLICRLRKENKKVYVLTITNGARGSRGNFVSEEELGITRIEEQRRALSVYKVPSNHFSTLNYKDGEAENNMELIEKISYVVRKFKPEIVCTHNPYPFFSKDFSDDHYLVNHKDHRVCGVSAMDAVYPFSRDRNFFTEHAADGLEPHVVREIMFTASLEDMNTSIELSSAIKYKEMALAEHKSQFDKKAIEMLIKYFKDGGKDVERGLYLKLH